MPLQNNNQVKRLNLAIEYTPEQLKEFIQCATDPLYFISHYVKIVTLDKGLVDFAPYEYQLRLAREVIENRFTICKLPRQSGKTTIMAALLLWYAMFNPDYSVGVLAHKEAQAHEIINRIKKAYLGLPVWLQQGVTKWNEGSVHFENGSRIISSGTTGDSFRGESINFLYLDEFAIVNNNIQEEFMRSVYPIITSGTESKIVITSTPKGLNTFWAIWKKSEEGKNSYKRVEIHWNETPGRDEAWKKETISNTSAEQFEQEFECQFLGSSNTLINGKILSTMSSDTPLIISPDGNLKVYKYPHPSRVYTTVVDTSRGVDGDFSAFIVFDVTEIPYTMAAVFRDKKIDPLIYPSVVRQVAADYNNSIVLVESNDIGAQVAAILVHDLEYEFVLRTTPKGRAGITLANGEQNAVLGVRTTAATKRIGCLTLKPLVENHKLLFCDEDLILEASQFVQKGKSYESDEGYHDDLMMCCVLFAWMTNQPLFIEMQESDVRRNLLKQMSENLEENVLPFGFITVGESQYSDKIEDVGYLEFDRWLIS